MFLSYVSVVRIKAMHSGNSFGIRYILGKIYRLSQNKKSENSGTFSYCPSLSTGLPFRKSENVTKIIPKQVSKNGRNHCLNLTKTTRSPVQTNHLIVTTKNSSQNSLFLSVIYTQRPIWRPILIEEVINGDFNYVTVASTACNTRPNDPKICSESL